MAVKQGEDFYEEASFFEKQIFRVLGPINIISSAYWPWEVYWIQVFAENKVERLPMRLEAVYQVG